MELYSVVRKLIGEIDTIGETNEDGIRFENLKVLCVLVNKLAKDIDDVAYLNKNAHEMSLKRAADYARKFMEEL